MSAPGPRMMSLVGALLSAVVAGLTWAEEPAASPPVRTDLYGDPLPPGAIARLGTTRYRHPGGITSLHFLPDNKTVIGVGMESRLSLWEAETGKRLREISAAPLNIAGFALSRDGKQIAVGGYWWPEEAIKGPQGEVRVLDAVTGGTIKTFPRESRDANHLGLVFSRDGKLLLSLGEEGVLRVEEIASGVEILQNKFPADNGPELALSPDGKTLAIVCGPNRRKFFLWEWQSGNEPRELKRTAADGGSGRMVFSPSGRQVVFCGDRDEPLHVWDVESGKLVANLFLPDPDTVTSGFAVFSPDGKQLLVPAGRNQDWPVHVWNAETWKFERKLDIKTLRFTLSGDGKFLSTGRRTFNLQTGQGVGGGEVGHNSEVSRVLFAPQRRAITGSFDGTVRFWDLATGRQEKQLSHDFFIQGFVLSPDGQLLVSGSLDDTVRLWNVASGKEIYRLPGHGTRAGQAVIFMEGGKSFASFGGDFFVRIWDVRTGKALVENRIEPAGVKLPEEGEDPFATGFYVDHVQFSARGKYLVLSIATKLHVFETATGKEIHVLEREGSSLAAMEISPDERQLLACSRGKQEAVKLPDGRMRHFTAKETIVSVWDLPTGSRLHTFKAADGARAATFSPDGKQFAIATYRPKNQVAIYDLRGAEPRVVDDIPSRTYCLALGADGKLIVGLDDSSALIYDLNSPLKK